MGVSVSAGKLSTCEIKVQFFILTNKPVKSCTNGGHFVLYIGKYITSQSTLNFQVIRYTYLKVMQSTTTVLQ